MRVESLQRFDVIKYISALCDLLQPEQRVCFTSRVECVFRSMLQLYIGDVDGLLEMLAVQSIFDLAIHFLLLRYH